MRRMILLAVAAVAALGTLAGVRADPALAATPAETAVTDLLNAFNGSVFYTTDTVSDCLTTNSGGNCWWWGAITFNALITYAEKNPDVIDPNSRTGATYKQEIEADLWAAYNNICGSTCPTTADQRGSDNFAVNTKGNAWFDDIGWWTQTWLNAYKLVGRPYYLYLAEQLWDYVTYNGYAQNTQTPCNTGSGSGIGVVQFHNADGTIGDPDTFANALYLRNSAWLYSVTSGLGDAFAGQYMQGVTYLTDGKNYGGALNTAGWIRQHLIFVYSGTVGSQGVQFMMADHYGADEFGNCAPGGAKPQYGAQWELHGQGAMVQAWTDLAIACQAYSCGSGKSAYYFDLADELAHTVRYDYPSNVNEINFYPNYVHDASHPYSSTYPPNQITPTVYEGILAEPCSDPSGSWPYNCDLGTKIDGTDPYKAILISKGVFEEAISCLSNYFPGGDSVLSQFISDNASSIASLPHFGFSWDPSNPDNTLSPSAITATRTAVLDGLEANVGNNYEMC